MGFEVGLKPKIGFGPVEEIEGNYRVGLDFVEDFEKKCWG